MVGFLTFLYAYLGLTACLIFVLLFGDAPWARGTPIAFGRWLVAEAWIDALEWSVNKACGLAGLRWLDAATECCCERSNPALQFLYLTIWSVAYGLYWEYLFALMPNAHAPSYHMYTGTACVCLTLASFLLASTSSPGAVTPDNAARYLAAYPPDGLLFPAKMCTTCKLPRPGRSKHCGVCGSCVPRFDHHCGWINTCVGLHNTRTFLAFLAVNLATCVYALWLAVAVLRGELQRRGLLDVHVYDPVQRLRVPIYRKPTRLLELLMVYYPVQVALCLFILVGGVLMAIFLLHQAYLISAGCTTYESFKRHQVHKEQLERAAAAPAAQGAPHQSGSDGSSGGTVTGGAGVDQSSSSRPSRQRLRKPPAVYDRGLLANWHEVLAPEHFLQQQARRCLNGNQLEQQRQRRKQH